MRRKVREGGWRVVIGRHFIEEKNELHNEEATSETQEFNISK